MFFQLLNPLVLQFASTAAQCKNVQFFGLKPWFAYLPDASFNADCTLKGFNVLGGNSGFLLIGLAVVDDLLRVAALTAVGFVIFGGIQYVTSQGEPDATAKARQTIINALIGVAVAVVATGIVSFIGKGLTS